MAHGSQKQRLGLTGLFQLGVALGELAGSLGHLQLQRQLMFGQLGRGALQILLQFLIVGRFLFEGSSAEAMAVSSSSP